MKQDEFSLIQHISPKEYHQPGLICGIGDDAALVKENEKYDEVICVDTLVEGVHFLKETMSYKQVGYKSLAVNLSDLAAMGAIPAYYLVSIAIPLHYEEREVQEIYKGMHALALNYKMDLIGGDTVSTKGPLVITVTVIGYVEKERHLLRSKAKVGDTVFVTNVVGSSACGLQLLLKYGRNYPYKKNEQEVIKSHQRPIPQIKAGRILAKSNARIALNDVSDGIASELHEISEASQVTIMINDSLIPYHPYLMECKKEEREKWAFFGGEDFQLIGTVEKEAFQTLKKKCQQIGVALHSIGIVIKKQQSNVLLKREETIERLDKKGYNHFV